MAKFTKNWFVYVVLCRGLTYYTGITTDVERRVKEHNDGNGAKYTRGRGPVYLMKSWGTFTQSEALKLELQFKKLSKMNKAIIIENCGEFSYWSFDQLMRLIESGKVSKSTLKYKETND